MTADGLLGAGESWATAQHLCKGATPGPTVVVTAGIHGNEPAAVDAASRIACYRISRGRLAVLPRANVRAIAANSRWTPGAERAVGNLNRNFPRSESDEPRDPLAAAIWAWVRALEPDWVLDLHEGLDFRRANPKSVGNTLIAHPTPEGLEEAARLVDVADETVDDDAKRFVLLETAAAGSLARAAAERLGAHTLILETTSKEPWDLRVRQHRRMVAALLCDLAILEAVRPEGAG